MLSKIVKVCSHPEKILYNLGRRGFLNWMDDETYIKLYYYCVFRKWPNLEEPKTFSEKIQWLKLHDRNPIYSTIVDKFEVKSYVANIIGQQYIIPTLGVWDSFDEIDFSTLPEQFVLKCTHDSGGLVICRDRKLFDKKAAKKKIEKSLKQNFYYFGREWPYKDVKPRIIAETYMEDRVSGELKKAIDLVDYKFYCFNGIPEFCQVISNRTLDEKIDFFDMDWNLQEFVGLNPNVRNSFNTPQKPVQYDLMKELATLLAGKISNPFVRVDLYLINKSVYFGEITFYPLSGFGSFRPDKWNELMGKQIRCFDDGE